MEQRTEEWLEARRGMITASRFGEVMKKPRNGKGLSAAAESYLNELIGEAITGRRAEVPTNRAMQWGIDTEDQAIHEYEQRYGLPVTRCGFCTIPETQVGASPDGLIGDSGGIEVKCPYNTARHVRTLRSREVPPEYLHQVLGGMLVCDRDWWDFVSFDPRIPGPQRLVRIRVFRDHRVDELLDALIDFNQHFFNAIEEITSDIRTTKNGPD